MSPRLSEFSITVPAKWVLTGEHSVLRGYQALAFPLSDFHLKLSYQTKASPNPFQSQIHLLISRAIERLKLKSDMMGSGEIDIESTIPIGAGLGSSAALSVAVARLVLWKSKMSEEQVEREWIPLATHLEDVFHGKSSGMDVNVIARSEPILFSKTKCEVLKLGRLPTFQFYDTSKRGQTSLAIARVKVDEVLDLKMQSATDLAKDALYIFLQDQKQGLFKLAESMNLAQSCFESWGLVDEELLKQKNELLKQGALAVKLTGAGLGGFWVALWDK